MSQIPTVGTVSHATLRAEDLLPAFADALAAYSDKEADIKLVGEARQAIAKLNLAAEARQVLASHGSPELDADAAKLAALGGDPGPTLVSTKDAFQILALAVTVDDIIVDLVDALDAVAACHEMYFGALEGDGSDFGFWPLPDSDENQP